MVENPCNNYFDDDFGEFDDEFDEYEDDVTSDREENELFTYTEFSNTLDVCRSIAIYSSQAVMNHSSHVKFFKEKKQHSNEHISDDNDHYILAGNDYMACNYLEKTFENV